MWGRIAYLFFKAGSLRPSESTSEASISTLEADSITKTQIRGLGLKQKS